GMPGRPVIEVDVAEIEVGSIGQGNGTALTSVEAQLSLIIPAFRKGHFGSSPGHQQLRRIWAQRRRGSAIPQRKGDQSRGIAGLGHNQVELYGRNWLVRNILEPDDQPSQPIIRLVEPDRLVTKPDVLPVDRDARNLDRLI